MESKKINQLATELTPALSDLTIIGDPTTGISKKITLSQMASLFTGTVEEYANVAAFPLVGVADTIYIALDTNVLYRWDTSLTSYVELSPNIINSLVFSDANGFDGNISLVGSVATLTITTALTTGSIPFIGASGALSQDNANLFFDDTNNRLGLGTNAPTTALDVFGSGIIGRINGTSTNNAYLGFASAGTNKWSIGNVQSDHRFRIYNDATTSELVSVLQTGEFGIGIANPTTKVHIDGGSTALIANLDANVSVAKSISFRSDNSNRINLEVSGTESGSNAGANFFIRTYTDAGSLIETPLSIVRSTGVTTIKSLTLTNALSVPNGGTGITSLTAGYIPFGNGTSAFSSSSNFYWETANNRLWIDRNDTGNISMILKNAYLNQGSLLQFQKNITTTGVINAYIGYGGDSSNNFIINHGGSDKLTISSTGATTFINTITNRIGHTIFGSSGAYGTGDNPFIGLGTTASDTFGAINAPFGDKMRFNAYHGFQFYTSNGGASGTPTTMLTIDTTGNTTFVGNINLTGSGEINHTGRLILDAGAGNGFLFRTNNVGTNAFDIQSNGSTTMNGGYFQINARLTTYADGTHSIQDSNPFDTGSRVVLEVIGGTYNTGSDSSSKMIRFKGGNGTEIGYIIRNGGATISYISSSDYRLKEDLKEFNGLDLISKIKTYDFKWKCSEHRDYGVIAHELKEVIPNIVSGEKDEVYEETGDIKPQGLDYGKLTPILIKAIQELKAEIELLKLK
jgi:hypothetical protein